MRNRPFDAQVVPWPWMQPAGHDRARRISDGNVMVLGQTARMKHISGADLVFVRSM